MNMTQINLAEILSAEPALASYAETLPEIEIVR